MREKRTPSSRWTPEHWMQVSTPRLVLSHVGSARLEPNSCLEVPAPPLRCPLPTLPAPTAHLQPRSRSTGRSRVCFSPPR